jgi:MFS family permease
MASAREHASYRRHQAKRATASGWIGSALEYYDFFIYATAASLIFPQIFFPQSDPAIGIIASLSTYGVGYVARPIGAIVLGHWGDTHGRKHVLIVCMLLMGFSTLAVGLLPTYAQVGPLAPALLVDEIRNQKRHVQQGAGWCQHEGRRRRRRHDDRRRRWHDRGRRRRRWW